MGNLTTAEFWDERHLPDIERVILGDNPHSNELLYPVLDKYLRGAGAPRTGFELGFTPGQGLRKLADR